MSQEPQFGSLFGAPTGSPSAPLPSSPPPGGAEVVQGGPSSGRPAAGPWYRRRGAVVAGAGLGVAVVLGAVAFVVLGGGGDDLTATGATVARSTRTATPSGTTAPSTGAVRPANRNPFSGKAAAAGTGSAGATTTTTKPVAATTVVKTVSSVVTTTRTATRTTTTTKTKTATATVTASPTYVYLLSLTGAAGDAVFVVNGEEKAPASPNDTVVTNLEYTGTSSATCAKVSWKAGTAQTICVGAGTRVDD